MMDKMRIYANPTANDLHPASLASTSLMIKQRGFTLIEVLVVIGIIGIVAAIAMPRFVVWMDHNGVNSATSALMINLKKARNLAAAESRSIYVSFDTVNNTFTYDENRTNAGLGGCSTCKNEVTQLSQFSKNLAVTSNVSPIKFKSNGSIAGLGASVTLSKSGYSKTITLNALGRAYGN